MATQVHGHALVLHKSLNKRISAEGNTKPLVARCHEALDLSDDALQAATAIVQAAQWRSLSHMSALRTQLGRCIEHVLFRRTDEVLIGVCRTCSTGTGPRPCGDTWPRRALSAGR